MTDDSQGPKTRREQQAEMAQIRREMQQEAERMREEAKRIREEAHRARDEMRADFQRQMAEQMAQMEAYRGRRGPHHGEPFQRGRGRPRGNLSRELIVETALKLMHKKGLDKTTMRAIAHELNTGPASIYAYVKSAAELHGLMLDHLFSTLDLTGGGGDWRERIRTLVRGAIQVLIEHPELARSALAVRPMGDGSLSLVERLLELLEEGGVEPAKAAWGVDILLLYGMATASEHAMDSGEDDDAPERLMEIARAGTYPHISAVGDALVGGLESDRVDWAIDMLLNGIAATPVPHES